MKKSLLYFGFMLLTFASSLAQTVKNVQAHVEGNKVYIYYDLISSTQGQKFNVELRSSIDNFINLLKEVSGDVGPDQEPGLGKTIIWNAIAEQGNFSGSVSFEVTSILTFSPLQINNPTAKSGAKIGKNLDVQWTGGDRGRNLKMVILQGSKTITEIPNVGSSGNYQWQVPKSVAKGNNYQVKLFDPAKPNAAAMSAEFQLKKTSVLVYILPGVAVVGVAAFLLLNNSSGECTNPCDPNCSNYNPSDPACVTKVDLADPPPLPGGGG
jgi:hypothetical protein